MSKLNEPPFWFIFGESPCRKFVDISDGERDVHTRVPRAEAERMIEEHNKAWHAWVGTPEPVPPSSGGESK